MHRHLLTHVLRWGTSSILASLMVLSMLAWSGTPAFAAPCSPGSPLDASGGSASCDMSITAQINPGALTLTNDAAATVPGSPFTLTGSNILATFSFTSIVKDHRGSTSGWRLEAASAGLKNGTATLPLSLVGLDPSSTCVNGTCPPVSFTPVTPLTTTSSRFLAAGNPGSGVVVDGDYTNKINGIFNIVPGSPSGTYTGVITISLVNSF